MFWILLFAAIAIVGLVVAFITVRWTYRRFRDLLGSVERFGARLGEGADALARIETQTLPVTEAGSVDGQSADGQNVDSDSGWAAGTRSSTQRLESWHH